MNAVNRAALLGRECVQNIHFFGYTLSLWITDTCESRRCALMQAEMLVI